MKDEEDILMNPTEPELSAAEHEAEENRMRAFVRMAHRRQHSHPDTDEAWEAFRKEKMTAQPPRKLFSTWHLSAAAVIGAAAMLALVFLFHDNIFSSSEPQKVIEMVALQYDHTPQQVKLVEDNSTVDLTQKDSISYRATTAPNAVAQKQPTKLQRLSTPRGMDFKVTLPDGSEVQLNAESTIEFPASFQSGERRVNLRGEAYFKVARNEQSPFIVTSDQLNIKVLGTEFNLKSYSSETAHVTLVKGKVEVMRPGEEVCDVTLAPGEDAWYDEKGHIQVEQADTYALTQWVNGFFYFHDQPLVKVLCDLGRWYNLGVVFRNREALHYKVHFSALRNESIDHAIESLNRLRLIKVKVEGNNIVVW